MPPRPLTRLRKLCLALPEAHEVEAWETPTFRVRNKLFAMYSESDHTAGRPTVWIKALPVNQEIVLRRKPRRYFSPPYVGKGGWIGVWLDGEVPWDEVKSLLEDGWELAAPKRLVASVRRASEAPTPPRPSRKSPRKAPSARAPRD